ncbi:MAG TPA: hypothetical protein VFE45_15395 [Coriobacteriia bacterium]|nr:hypothetical protein [Coriobacteriia bacterium]
MLALAQWRDEDLCPLCGWPKAICQDQATEGRVTVPPPTRCHITTAMHAAQKAYGDSPGARPDGLVWGAGVKDPTPSE